MTQSVEDLTRILAESCELPPEALSEMLLHQWVGDLLSMIVVIVVGLVVMSGAGIFAWVGWKEDEPQGYTWAICLALVALVIWIIGLGVHLPAVATPVGEMLIERGTVG